MAKSRKEDIPGCSNPEFAGWLWDWYKEAQDADSRYQFTLRKAFDSMIRCEEKLKNGRETVKLSGIGPGISDKLERKLQQYISDGNLWHYQYETVDLAGSQANIQSILRTDALPENLPKHKTAKLYIPRFKSIAYGIVVALYQCSLTSGLTRSEIARLCQQHANVAVSDRAIQTHLNNLISKDIVEYNRGLSTYYLSDAGRLIGDRIRTHAPCVSSLPIDASEHAPQPENEVETWPRDQFEVLLFIDTREVKSRQDRDSIVIGLEKLNISVVQAPLSLGDVLYVARHLHTKEDIVLNYIIERKTDSDLIASIPDGRYKEQKHRLRGCGLGNIVYLFEGSGEGITVTNFGEDKYFAALSQTLFSDGFHIKRCHSIEETIQYLAGLYSHIDLDLEGGLQVIRPSGNSGDIQIPSYSSGVPLEYFMSCTSKSSNLTFFDLFVMQLACVRGVSTESAMHIASQYGDFESLIKFVDENPDDPSFKGTAKIRELLKT